MSKDFFDFNMPPIPRKLILYRINAYLENIRAWAMGKDNRGWVRDDFDDDACTNRLDPTQIIFPINPYPGDINDLGLDQAAYEAALELFQWIANFNSTLLVVNQARFHYRDPEYLDLIVLLHAGVIGTKGTPGLHEAFLKLEGLVN